MTKQGFSPEDAGCWFDGARGIYIGEAVIEAAVSAGWDAMASGYSESDLRCEPTNMDEQGNPDYMNHYYDDATESAELFLSALAPDGYWIGFNDGDFGMYAIDEED